MGSLGAFKRGDEVLSKFPGGSIMMVLAVEGLKVRCADRQNTQYWFDTIMLERFEDPRRRRNVGREGSIRRLRWAVCTYERRPEKLQLDRRS